MINQSQIQSVQFYNANSIVKESPQLQKMLFLMQNMPVRSCNPREEHLGWDFKAFSGKGSKIKKSSLFNPPKIKIIPYLTFEKGENLNRYEVRNLHSYPFIK